MTGFLEQPILPNGGDGVTSMPFLPTESRFDPISTHAGCGPGSADEFAIILTTGHVIYTGGFEDIPSLKECIDNGEVAGHFKPRSNEYYKIDTTQFATVAIIDLRAAV